MATVDSLDITISAQADSAAKALDRLISRLNTLGGSFKGLDTSGFSKLSNAANKLSNSLKSTHGGMGQLSKASNSLALSFGKLYATIKTAEKGIKSFGQAVKSSMDYVETLNYFDAAFGQIAERADLSNFEKLGYSTAEEYAASFAKRAKELTAKMTGFQVTDTGELVETGNASLGISPNQLMNYQAMFAQMSSSIGVSSEMSLKLSRALTEIGADLASVKNMDFNKVWQDMASGLAGMSRTLDKYGANIRNVNLQQKLNELGINANIAALNQNDKALLRTIILLDSTRYAWANMSTTIEQPANSLRLLKANLENLGRIIGNLFLPAVQAALPYINAFVIALQRLFTWVGNLAGVKWPDWGNATPDNSALGDILDQSEELTTGLNNAANSAKKLKKSLQSFDELNVINSTSSAEIPTENAVGLPNGALDSALNDILSEYQKKWDEGFANMERRAQQLAGTFEKAFEPVKRIISDFAIGDFFQAGKDVSNLAVSITDFFASAIDNVDWYKIGQNMGNFLAGIDWTAVFSSTGNLIWQGLNAAIETWKGSFDTAPFETAFLSILALPALTGFGTKLVALIAAPFVKVYALISPIISGIGALISGLSAPALIATGAFAVLTGGLAITFKTNEEVRKSFDNALTSIREGLQPAIEFFTGTLLPDLASGWSRITEILNPFGEFLEGAFTGVWQDMLNPALTYLGETVLPVLTGTFENLWNNVLVPLGNFIASVFKPVIQTLSGVLDGMWKNIVVPLADALGNVLEKAFEGLCDVFNNTVIPIANSIISVFKFLLDTALKPLGAFLQDTFEPIFTAVFGNMGGIIDGLSETFGGLIDFVTGVFAGDWDKAWQGVVDSFSGIFNTLGDFAKAPLNLVIGLINGALAGLESGLNFMIDGINSIKLDVPDWVPAIGGTTFGFAVPSVSFGRIDYLSSLKNAGVGSFELGGYPEPASLFWAGENGVPELLGTVGGRTAVAGGAEITGISDAIRETASEEILLLQYQNELLMRLLEKDMGFSSRKVFNAMKEENRRYKFMTGHSAFE